MIDEWDVETDPEGARFYGLDAGELRDALLRVGIDVLCPACADWFYTGAASDRPHGCKLGDDDGRMPTYGGGWFSCRAPRAEDVLIEDVAHALSMTCRYGGMTQKFYSVAEHSLIVSQFVPPEFALHALLYDAPKAYVGDVRRPVKRDPRMAGYRQMEAEVEAAVWEAFGLEWTPEATAAVKDADERIYVDEARRFLHRDVVPEALARAPHLRALDAVIPGLKPSAARHVFLSRFADLWSARG